MLYCYSGLQATTFITSNKIKGIFHPSFTKKDGKFLPSLMTDYLIQSVALLPQGASSSITVQQMLHSGVYSTTAEV